MTDSTPLLFFGMFVTSLAVVYTCIGKVYDHSFSWIERAKDPKAYWAVLALYYLGGLGFVLYYLYQLRLSSH